MKDYIMEQTLHKRGGKKKEKKKDQKRTTVAPREREDLKESPFSKIIPLGLD